MKELNFDKNGLITPNKPTELKIEEIQSNFVDAFQTETSNRKELYQIFIEFIDILKTTYPFPIEIWINGSFVTKKMNPNDIDIIVFIPFNNYDETIFNHIKKTYKQSGLDIYPLIQYPKEHRKFDIFESDRLYWYHLFTKTKRSRRTKKSHSKGFIKLFVND